MKENETRRDGSIYHVNTNSCNLLRERLSEIQTNPSYIPARDLVLKFGTLETFLTSQHVYKCCSIDVSVLVPFFIFPQLSPAEPSPPQDFECQKKGDGQLFYSRREAKQKQQKKTPGKRKRKQ